jgi:ribonuclease HII
MEIEEIKKIYGEVGSGYATDVKTIRFLEKWVREKGELPPFARASWKTCKRFLNN